MIIIELIRRTKFAHAVMTGRVKTIPQTVTEMELVVSMENLKAAVATADAAVDLLVGLSQSNAAAAAAAKALADSAEQEALSIVTPTLQKIIDAAPPPPSTEVAQQPTE